MLRAVICFLIVVLLYCCASTEAYHENPDTVSVLAANAPGVPESLDGYWILTDYIDSIYKDKSIAKHRLYRLAWMAICFKIESDSLFTNGLLYAGKKAKLDFESDTLCIIEDWGTYVFKYNKANDCIEAINVAPDESDQFADKRFTFRRIVEARLLNIVSKSNVFEIENGFYQLFIDSLIAGTYDPVGGGTPLKFGNDGFTTGFKSYNKYGIHDYFGTLHPFQNYDAINFIDTTIKPQQGPPSQKQSCYYNWRYTGDTLILTELLTENYDEYFLGTSSYRFVKIK